MFIYEKFRFKWVWVVVSIWGSFIIAWNSTIYFQSEVTPVFLLEKGSLVDSSLWLTSLKFHIVAACSTLLLGTAILLDSKLRFKRLHVIFGNLYVCLTLWIVVPTGLILAPVAKGGWVSAIGFALTGAALWWATWSGYQAIRRRQINSHIAWMVRSYSLSLSAVFFRIIQLGLVALGFGNSTAYVAAVWLSLVTSIVVAECCIVKQFPDQRFEAKQFFSRFKRLKELDV